MTYGHCLCSESMSSSNSDSFFDHVAEQYASWYHGRSPGGYALRVRHQHVLTLLEQDQSGGKILDVGCGPGFLLRDLLERGYLCWGVDASPRMIEQCVKKFGSRAHFAIGDATRLEFPDGFFDAVICTGVIDHISNHDTALREMVRILKREGTLLVSFPNLVSPYAVWRKFVFYPVVRRLRPIYLTLTGHPQPHPMPTTYARLHKARKTIELVQENKAKVTEIVYFYFNIMLSPLDELFPRMALRTSEALERLRGGPLRWLGAGFILKARKS